MSGSGSRLELLALALLCACGGSPRPTSGENGALADARENKARRLAPDLYLLAERARGEATKARNRGHGRAALDHDARARLLLDAALAEAERIELERRRARAERKTERALTEAARLGRERLRIEQEVGILEAARVARLEAGRVLEPAGAGQRGAVRGRKRARDAPAKERDFYLRRARLLLAAAVSMDAARDRVREAERAIRQAAARKGTDAVALNRARKALRAAERALDDSRAKGSATTTGNPSPP